jgi:hypothetical protein
MRQEDLKFDVNLGNIVRPCLTLRKRKIQNKIYSLISIIELILQKQRKPKVEHLNPGFLTECWWLTPVILATGKAEIRRITVQN